MTAPKKDDARPPFSVKNVPADYFDLLPQSAVRYTAFPEELPHNAIWDFARGANGTMYASLCGEQGASVCVRLYEYLPVEGKLRFCFDGGAVTMAHPRMIPPSKIHTSIQPLPDGRLIMTTHNTARAAGHPHWLFDSYYTHIWEGFPGSHVILWDPARREARSLGIPVPRDSIYGAVYDERHHAYWFTTFLRGHLWRLDLTTMQTRDFGQITEVASYCICRDRRGHLYTSSRSGHVFRIDVDTCEVRDLGVFAREPEAHPWWKRQRHLGHHAQGPDGRLYVSFRFSDHLYAIDPDTLSVERTPPFAPPGREGAPLVAQKGLAFDSKGVLWSVTIRPMDAVIGNLCHLHRWDLLRGGKPECVGLLGTPERATTCVSEMLMDGNDVLHLADSNHGEDMPGVLSVDTRKLAGTEKRLRTRDAAAYLLFADGADAFPGPDFERKAERYRETARKWEECCRFVSTQANTALRAREVRVVRLWEMLGRGKAAVAALRWEENDVLTVWCGPSGAFRLRIRDGKIVERADSAGDCPVRPPAPAGLQGAHLPARQGRQYLAQAACWTPWRDGQWLVGTLDGVVARFDPRTGRCCSLGAVGVHGPVHQIAVDAACSGAFGVSGDPQDLGHVFHYDDDGGLREVGRLTFSSPEELPASNTQPTTAALSRDGSRLAVGVIDDLACVYIYSDVRID